MGLNVLIVPDKFKGTLTAESAAQSIASGWRKSRPMDVLDMLPMSDGGDGFGAVISSLLAAKALQLKTLNAAHQSCRSDWWWAQRSRLGIIESASVIGLAMLPAGRFHPFELDTFGLAAALEVAARKGARECLIGIGGSATNDGGLGMARGLGWVFLDADGKEITSWTRLNNLQRIQRGHSLPYKIRVAVDVQNPLLGPKGASRVYGPQKGLRPGDMAQAEKCLRRLARVTADTLKKEFATIPGAGAAGGLGFGLAAFCGAQLEPGFELFASLSNLAARLAQADLVITGEGKLDHSTLMGKGVGEIARLAARKRKNCIGLGGTVLVGSQRKSPFSRLFGITDLTSEKNALQKPAFWLARLAEHAARNLHLVTPSLSR
jgi:glycerate kinase